MPNLRFKSWSNSNTSIESSNRNILPTGKKTKKQKAKKKDDFFYTDAFTSIFLLSSKWHSWRICNKESEEFENKKWQSAVVKCRQRRRRTCAAKIKQTLKPSGSILALTDTIFETGASEAQSKPQKSFADKLSTWSSPVKRHSPQPPPGGYSAVWLPLFWTRNPALRASKRARLVAMYIEWPRRSLYLSYMRS